MRPEVRLFDERVVTLSSLIERFRQAGATRLYAKRLTANDNSKNQVYFGPGFSAVNLLPSGTPTVDVSGKGRVMKASLEFYWLTVSGGLSHAPGAQLILYPQYPEVRMSGFLLGSRDAPNALMTSRTPGRVLLLAVCAGGLIIGYVGGPGCPFARELAATPGTATEGVFTQIPIRGTRGRTTREILIAELRRIHDLGWIDSKRLGSSGGPRPYRAQNGGGYTLEAELGVRPNGYAEPDFEGWEVKQYGVNSFDRIDVGVLTLMTPEPTGGLYKSRGVEYFVRTYGYKDKRGRAGRMNFGGVHRVGERQALTGLTMELAGYDHGSGKLIDPSQGIRLVAADGEVAAEWSYPEIMAHWNRKHAQAVFVPSMKKVGATTRYRYGSTVSLGEGTEFLRLLHALGSKEAYYDPGIKLEGIGAGLQKSKRRSQFRMKTRNLASLYARFESVDVTAV